jgi:hypothetical protein
MLKIIFGKIFFFEEEEEEEEKRKFYLSFNNVRDISFEDKIVRI